MASNDFDIDLDLSTVQSIDFYSTMVSYLNHQDREHLDNAMIDLLRAYAKYWGGDDCERLLVDAGWAQ